MKRTRLLRTSLVALPLFALSGCSAEPETSPARKHDGEAPIADSTYGVKLYFDTPSGMVRTQIGLQPPVSRTDNPPASSAQAVIGLPDGDATKEYHVPARLGSFLLTMAAAAECGLQEPPAGETNYASAFDANIAKAPWDAGAYYVFAGRYDSSGPAFNSCDDILFHEEILMCMAGKFNDLANAVGPVVWKGPANLHVYPEWTTEDDPNPAWKNAWIIPPQRMADKFLLRDLSINILAHLARLDQEKPQSSDITQASCTEAYADAAQDSVVAGNSTWGLFHRAVDGGQVAPYFLPWGSDVAFTDNPVKYSPAITADTARLMAAGRLDHRARILRNAAQLLQEQVRQGVYADLAGASRLKAMAGDETAGLEYFWGVRNQADYPYNTAAHALRMVTGRYEIWAPTVLPYTVQTAAPGDARIPWYDPACSGYFAIEALPGNRAVNKKSALGPEMSARWRDRALRAPAQQFSTDLLQSAGIVIPSSAVDIFGIDAARAAVIDQLQRQQGLRLGFQPGTQDYSDWLAGDSANIQKVVDGVSDADLTYGIDHSFQAFRTVHEMPEDGVSISSSETANFREATSDPGASPLLESIGAGVLTSGVKREEAIHDYFARAAGAFNVSQCEEQVGSKVAAFQSTFVLGDVLRERLTLLRNRSQDSNPAKGIAAAAAAELRNWSGGRVVLNVENGDGVRALNLTLSGIEPAQLGVESEDEMLDQLRLVYGPAWAADCVAGQRSECPDDIESYAVNPMVSMVPGDDDGVTLEIQTTDTSWAGAYRPTFDASPAFSRAALFLVSKTDPAAPGRGKVLAALTLRAPLSLSGSTTIREVVSDQQRKYINDIVGLGPDWAGKGVRLGPGILGQIESYCIEDVPRDFFVPLENELTSDSDEFEDSWKHYLDIATLAANRADDLGNQLIQQGLADDQEAEGVREQLGEICGDFGALDRLNLVDGQVVAPPNDSILQQCFDEPKFDVVFLTNDPFEDLDAQQATIAIRQYLGCDTGSTSDLCDQSMHPTISHAGLNLAKWEDPTPPPTSPDNCENVSELLGSSFDYAKAHKLNQRPYMSEGAVGDLLGALYLYVEDDGNWSAKAFGKKVMSTRAPTGSDPWLWPACATVSNCAADPVSAALDRVFGHFTDGQLLAGEIAALRLRVSGAMWRLAGWTRGMGAGHISQPILAANFSQPADMSPAILVYANGQFDWDGIDQVWRLSEQNNLTSGNSFSLPTEARMAFGGATQVLSGFRHDLVSAGALNSGEANLPQEILDVYADPSLPSTSRYLHVRAENGSTVHSLPNNSVAKTIGKAISAASTACNNELPLAGDDRVICSSSHETLTAYWDEENQRYATRLKDYTWGTAATWVEWSYDPTQPVTETYAPTCRHIVQAGVPYVRAECAVSPFPPSFIPIEPLGKTNEQLSGPYCGKSDRVQLFGNSLPWRDGCKEQDEIVRAHGLACALQHVMSGTSSPPPSISEVNDLSRMEGWLRARATDARKMVSGLIVRDVPRRAVEDQKSGAVGSGRLSGQHGVQVLELEKDLSSLASGWLGVESATNQLADAISATRLELTGIDLSEEQQLNGLAMSRLNIQLQLAQASLAEGAACMQMSESLGGFATGNTGGVSSGFVSLLDAQLTRDFSERQMELLDQEEQILGNIKANQVSQSLQRLQMSANQTYTSLGQNFEQIRTSVAQALQSSVGLRSSEQRAKYIAARATNADYMLGPDNEPVYFPVNTVSRRLNGATRVRYEAALRDAKYLAYMARLAIEQRIGQRLSEIDEEVGTLEAPSLWADDVCSLSGVDYEKLSTYKIPDPQAPEGSSGEIEQKAIEEFADQFVGDYVNKLSNLVEFYNIKYPSHEADDTTVLSLRDDLMDGGGRCYRPSRNLLGFSGDLSALSSGNGWELNRCEPADARCLGVAAGALSDTGGAGATWLRETDGAPDPNVPGTSSIPGRMVAQRVELQAGKRYLWTWFDQARSLEGTLQATSPAEYQALVFAPNGSLLAVEVQIPHLGTSGDLWSDRRQASFVASESGEYLVGFKASSDGSAVPGSVAIADVQLEEAPDNGVASAYQPTEGSLTVLSGDCVEGFPEGFREAFEYKCDEKRCFYELRSPFIIDTESVISGDSKLSDRLASENFNFRHLTMALNVVGTGVLDCSDTPTSSCYGNGTIEYTLRHDATDTRVVGYDELGREFDFGSAAIRSGRALAAERFITLPISGADQGLLNQPQTTKPELRGRPLSGAYTLRIYDTPALAWDRVEDIQLVLNYRYWSRVGRGD